MQAIKINMHVTRQIFSYELEISPCDTISKSSWVIKNVLRKNFLNEWMRMCAKNKAGDVVREEIKKKNPRESEIDLSWKIVTCRNAKLNHKTAT